MTTELQTRKIPTGAKLEVNLIIDKDRWNQAKKNGYTEDDIRKALEKVITLRDTIGMEFYPPVFDIHSVSLLKYY